MGCLCSCFKSNNEDEVNETTPLTKANNSNNSNKLDMIIVDGKINETKLYKSVVDDAQGKFISSSFRHTRNRKNSSSEQVEDMKIKLKNSLIDPEILNLSTSNGGLGETLLNRLKKTSNKEINTGNIIDILSETIVVSHIHEIDRAADEIAELISQHVNIRVDDSSSTVVSFKPVIGSVTTTST